MNKSYEIPRRCPVCQGELTVKSVRCDNCQSELHGNFALPRLACLPQELQNLVELLVRCRGNLTEVERRMGVSYPTVSKKLDAVNMLLDATERQDDESARILNMIQEGEMTVTEAVRKLRGQGAENGAPKGRQE